MWVLNFSVMAKQRFGINDAYRGTVGTVIGYEWRGKWCLRSRPLRVRNPRTAKQQSNRMLFKQAVDLASHVRLALKKGLRGVSLGMHMTECNLFVKRNKECFSLDSEGRLSVDWERLIVSEGEVAAPVFVGVEPRPAASLQMGFEWDGGSGDDEVYVYAYCPVMEEGVLSAPAWRRMKSVQLALPERWQGKEVHFYGFSVDNEGNASTTAYIGSLSPVETRQAASLHETTATDVNRLEAEEVERTERTEPLPCPSRKEKATLSKDGNPTGKEKAMPGASLPKISWTSDSTFCGDFRRHDDY